MQRRESEILELKSSFGEWKEIIQTLCGFANKNGGTVIVGFDDSLEIRTPGSLPKEIDINNLTKTNRSIPKNRIIAKIFHKIEFIEAWGTGLLRIVDYCTNFGLQKPSFKAHQGAFIITFYKNKVSNEVTNEVTNLTDTQIKIIALIKENNHITINEMSENLAISSRKIKENISKLKEKGFLTRVGNNRTGYWKILK